MLDPRPFQSWRTINYQEKPKIVCIHRGAAENAE